MRTLSSAMFLHCGIASILLLAAVAHGGDSQSEGKAPMWLYEGETYGLWYSDLAKPDQMEHYKSFSFIIWGQPASNLEWLKRTRDWGVRSIAYVSFYKAPNIPQVEDRRKWEGGSPGIEECRKNGFWQAVDLSKHPEWALITRDGRVRRPFDKPDYPPGWNQVCTNVAGYTEAVLDGVRSIMQLGYDGLFIDNVHPSDCFGPEHGKHQHVHREQGNKETYKMLLAEVRRLVKTYGDDKVCVLNSGSLDPQYGPYGDAMMWESYIFEGGKRRHDWARISRAADEWKAYIGSGKAILALSYVRGDGVEERKENAFYAYACAKLSGFLWARYPELDGVRMGMPKGDMRVEDGVYYRLYEKGFVAVNPQADQKNVDIPAEGPYPAVLDLYTSAVLEVKDAKLTIRLPAGGGRVYLARGSK